MLATLKGTVRALEEQTITLDVHGVGFALTITPNKAEQIIVQLRSKVDHLIEQAALSGMKSDAIVWKEVSDALVGLNYSRPEVSRALQQVSELHTGKSMIFPELMRAALAQLAKR